MKLFRSLTSDETQKFRQWTHDNWTKTKPENFEVFHPVVRDEWAKLDREYNRRMENPL